VVRRFFRFGVPAELAACLTVKVYRRALGFWRFHFARFLRRGSVDGSGRLGQVVKWLRIFVAVNFSPHFQPHGIVTPAGRPPLFLTGTLGVLTVCFIFSS
jgi:hypothetical protein